MKEGKLLFAEGKLEKAEKCFFQALKEDPNNKEAYNNVGVIAFQKGDMKKAVDFFTSSLQIDPFYRDAVLNFSAVISKLSQFPEFIPYLEKLIEKHSNDSEISRLLKEATQSEGLRSSAGNERTKGGYQVRNLKISGVDDSAYKKLNTDRSKRVAFVLGVTGNWAFAAATVIVGLKKHLKNITDYDIIIFHSGLSDQEKEALNRIHECIFYEYDIRITKPDKFKRVSKLAFSRFECFDLLNYYETVAWLDSDILILGDISGMINSCQTGISMFLHKNIPMSVSFSDSVQGFDMNMECFNDGIFLINRKLSFREELKNWSYEKTNEYIDAINSDQAIFNLMLQQFDIKVTELAARFNCHPHALVENPVIVHPWGEQKFWNHYNNELWNAYYMEWMSKGGLESNEVKWNLKLDKETLLSSVVARSDFPELLNQLNLTNIGAEIGCQKGKFSDLILSKWKGRLLFSIDPWMEDSTGNYKDIANVSQEQQEQNYQETKSLLSIYGNRSKILRKSSYDASLGIEDNCLDFVYIDARHDYKSVLEDVELWTPKVRVGGIIAGHDYMNLKSANLVIEVKKAVDEYFGKMGWKIYRTLYDTIAYPSWWVVKQSSLTSIDDNQDNCEIDKCKVDCNEMSDRSKNLRGKEYSNLIDLKEFFRGVDDYVILKLSEDFPDYSAYSDIDILCRDRDAFLSHILTVGKAYERRGFRIEVNREGDNLHVDFYPSKAERLNLRFDLLDCLSYEKFSVDSQLCDIILNNRQSVNRGGVDIQVPIPEDELAIRFFEYVEWKDKRPDKVKHWEYIKKYYCPQFVEVVNKYTNLNVTVEQANGEIRLNVSAKDLTTDSPKKQRIDYFLIWGHGLQYTGEILDIIRSRKDFEIITIQKIHVDDMSKLVDDIYSCDTVPLQHLVDKTRYLLNTEPQILFILVKNNSPQEKLFGEGQFRHIQCQLVKDVKEEIRNKFNPRIDGKRTEHHVIHASDYEAQVEHVLEVLGLPTIEYFTREPSPELDVPYHIPPFDEYFIKQVDIDDLLASILSVGLVPITETPHYKYLTGDKTAYQPYYEEHLGKELKDDHCPEVLDRMTSNFQYPRTTEDGKKSLILVRPTDDDKYQILDGVHRAAILKFQGHKTIAVAEPVLKTKQYDLVGLIFSKDRAMQLQAAIESFLLHCRDSNVVDLTVLYKASNVLHAEQYEELKRKFGAVRFIGERDFRYQVVSTIERNDYILFLVDDNIFVKDFSVQDIVGAVREHTDAIGFSLRLGKNTTYCYTLSSPQAVPQLEETGNGILKYRWPYQDCDFGYPLEVSSSVYRCRDMLRLLNRLGFTGPNTLEGAMDGNKNFDPSLSWLLMFEESVAFANPVNVVQNVAANKYGTVNGYTAEELADYFWQGMAVDVEKYVGFRPNAAHQEVELHFKEVGRKCRKPKFSIVMANYNNAKYITEAIESVLNQTFKDWELIIVEDCSTDNSLEIIKRYLGDKRVRLVQHGQNRGYTAALKTGIASVNSKYFGILDSDDCLMPRAVEKMYEHYVKYPAFGFVYSQFVACHEDLAPRRIGFCGNIPVGRTNLEVNLVSHFKTFRLRDYLKTAGYDEDILYAEDTDIIFKMEEVTQLVFVDECLYLYRELPSSQCHDPEKERISKQSWEKAKENARRRRRQVRDKLLGPNANVPAEQLILRETDDAADYKPEFSIVMANYNNGRYVGDAIKSVLNQGFRNWELIIVDDGSTDNSIQVIEPYLCDKRIRLIKHERNKGCPAAEKTAISHVRSKYSGILDSDDCLAHNAIEVIYNEHISNPDCGFIYAQLEYCDENLLPFKKGINKAILPTQTSLDCDISQWRTFKLADYLKTQGLDEDFEYGEDKDVIYKMEEVTKLKFVDKVLYLCRELPDSQCHSQKTSDIGTIVTAKAKINALKRRCSASAESGSRTFQELFTEAMYTADTKYRDVEHYFAVLMNVLSVLRKAVDEGGQLKYLELPPEFMTRGVEDAVRWMAVDMKFGKLLELIKLIESRVGSAKKPLVSVCMVTYNNDKFIKPAIDSVLAQTYKNFELLIIDDGSTDRTKEVIASVLVDSDLNRKIRYIYKTHKNFASGANKAVIEAKGEYILNVDSDDFIEPDYIEKMVTFAEKYPDIDYFYPAALTLVDESGNPTQVEWNYHDFSDNKLLPAFLLDNGYSPIPNPGSLKRRTLFNKVELYEELETVEDFVFLCKNALKIRFKRVEEHSRYFYRRSPASNSFKFRARNELMARALNEMISMYPPEVLCPRIAGIKDALLKRRRYCEYLMMTFYKHANGKMVRYGEYFKQYGDRYKTELSRFSECSGSISTVDAVSDKQSFSDRFKRGVEHLKAARPADALVCFDEALRLGGELANLNYARAVALVQLGRADDARSACEAELAIQRNSQKARTLLERIAQATDAIRSAGEVQLS